MFEGFVFFWQKENTGSLASEWEVRFFLQETYSTLEVENIWKSHWKGDSFFSHGSEQSNGVMILFKEELDYEIKILKEHKQQRFIL